MVVDTNVVFKDYAKPLVASAWAGDLEVYWSGVIVREVCKVGYRQRLGDALGQATDPELDRRALSTLVARCFAETNDRIEGRLRLLDLTFRWSPDSEAAVTFEVVPDPADRPLFRAAHAAGADVLFTLDQRHLPHGRVFSGIRCWHPDTFLSLLYTQDPTAYDRALDAIDQLPGLSTLPRIL